ncbi:MAG: ABC transporter ATP-binding protein, partial [Peptococcaceae bacterium]|nr:ABC transporter ATP-binding protein [Peptococcaceae bacterium]
RAKVSKKMIKSTVREHLQMVGMAGFENYTPRQLSGGMQQRVAFARALALKPRMLLLDEPFASLDAQTRVIMQELLQDIHREYQTTTLLVTHDVEEALFLADKIYVLSKRPARVIEEFDVPFARPRGLTLRGEAGFAELKAALLKKIREQF